MAISVCQARVCVWRCSPIFAVPAPVMSRPIILCSSSASNAPRVVCGGTPASGYSFVSSSQVTLTPSAFDSATNSKSSTPRIPSRSWRRRRTVDRNAQLEELEGKRFLRERRVGGGASFLRAGRQDFCEGWAIGWPPGYQFSHFVLCSKMEQKRLATASLPGQVITPVCYGQEIHDRVPDSVDVGQMLDGIVASRIMAQDSRFHGIRLQQRRFIHLRRVHRRGRGDTDSEALRRNRSVHRPTGRRAGRLVNERERSRVYATSLTPGSRPPAGVATQRSLENQTSCFQSSGSRSLSMDVFGIGTPAANSVTRPSRAQSFGCRSSSGMSRGIDW